MMRRVSRLYAKRSYFNKGLKEYHLYVIAQMMEKV